VYWLVRGIWQSNSLTITHTILYLLTDSLATIALYHLYRTAQPITDPQSGRIISPGTA
jgi:hypothetical protein